MTTFHIITIFPKIFSAKGGSASGGDSCSYLNESILKRAQKNKLIKIKIYDLRKFTKDKHKKVDGKPYGGGPGMVIQTEPLVRAVQTVLNGINRTIRTTRTIKTKIVLFAPAGKQFNNKTAIQYSKYKHIILIAGRYEGVDARIKKIFSVEEISIGPYVLTGGELPAIILIDSVSRQISGVLGKKESLEENRQLGLPVYTRPEVFKFKGKNYRVPKVLLSGNHKKIEEWRKKQV